MSAHAGTLNLIEARSLDPLRSALADEFPGLATAFHAGVVSGHLAGAMLAGGHRIERCEPAQARYLPGSCLIRYRVELAGDGEAETAGVVTGRLFRSPSACRRHLRNRLLPLAKRAGSRAELGPFSTPAAALPELDMAASVFPLDGGLPTLVDGTDPARMGPLLGAITGAPHAGWTVRPARYGRGNRCVLRYEVDAGDAPVTVFGKVADDDSGARAHAVIEALRAQMRLLPEHRRFGVPRSLGFHRELRLLLLEAVPGVPRLSQLIKAHTYGQDPPKGAMQAAVESCAEIVSGLHTSGVALGRPRSASSMVAMLGAEIADIARVTPDLGRWLGDRLDDVQERLVAAHPLNVCLCHGDLKHNQILFDDSRRTLVDFDTVCQAEPALDLGHFLAYLRLRAADGDREPPATDLADRLSHRFLDAYIDAAGPARHQSGGLRDRVAVYEILSLLGRAVHSWQKFKPQRLALTITLLEERLSCLTP